MLLEKVLGVAPVLLREKAAIEGRRSSDDYWESVQKFLVEKTICGDEESGASDRRVVVVVV